MLQQQYDIKIGLFFYSIHQTHQFFKKTFRSVVKVITVATESNNNDEFKLSRVL
jgi:hypothetical protein